MPKMHLILHVVQKMCLLHLHRVQQPYLWSLWSIKRSNRRTPPVEHPGYPSVHSLKRNNPKQTSIHLRRTTLIHRGECEKIEWWVMIVFFKTLYIWKRTCKELNSKDVNHKDLLIQRLEVRVILHWRSWSISCQIICSRRKLRNSPI